MHASGGTIAFFYIAPTVFALLVVVSIFVAIGVARLRVLLQRDAPEYETVFLAPLYSAAWWFRRSPGGLRWTKLFRPPPELVREHASVAALLSHLRWGVCAQLVLVVIWFGLVWYLR